MAAERHVLLPRREARLLSADHIAAQAFGPEEAVVLIRPLHVDLRRKVFSSAGAEELFPPLQGEG
jgi:hypothetical protein